MPRTRRRPSWWIGLALVAGGLGVLAWLGWQFWGTNWAAKRTHDRINQQVHRAWDDGGSRREAVVEVPEGDVLALVRIPELGEDFEVPVLSGTSDEVLASGLGHFPDTAGPGEEGNFALAGHRITHGEPLRDLPDLEVGDEVVVETRDATYIYRLVTDGDALEVPFTETWVLGKLPDNPEDGGVEPDPVPGSRLLTLTTCAELFHTDDRMIAFAELVERTPR